MDTRARKQKGKLLQRRVRDDLLKLDPDGGYGSQIMGQAGSDIVDPFDRLPVNYVECRNHKGFPSLNSIKIEMDHKGKSRWFAILKANRQDPVVLMPYQVWINLMYFYLTHCSVGT